MVLKIKNTPQLLDGLATCPEHHCPMISVEEDGTDYYMCILEVVNQFAGLQRIVYAEVADGAIKTITFANGTRMEPLCACCGKPTLVYDPGIMNKVLVSLTWDDDDPPALVFQLGQTPESEAVLLLPVHPNSVRTFTAEVIKKNSKRTNSKIRHSV